MKFLRAQLINTFNVKQMNETIFWDIINSAKEINPNDIGKQTSYIENVLSKHSIKEIREFNYISETLITKAKNEGIH